MKLWIEIISWRESLSNNLESRYERDILEYQVNFIYFLTYLSIYDLYDWKANHVSYSNNFYFSDTNEPKAIMNFSADQDYKGGDDIYQKQLAIAPIWYHYLVMITLSTLGMVGVFLNGYVIGCFLFCSIVSILFSEKLWSF